MAVLRPSAKTGLRAGLPLRPRARFADTLSAMAEGTRTGAELAAALDNDAEVLALHQLDLLAQLEAQIRAVHHTMRCIETVRSPRFRVGPELTPAERSEALTRLSNELNSIDGELRVQH